MNFVRNWVRTHVPSDDRRFADFLLNRRRRGKQTTVERAYALYDFVFHTVRYDKSGTGWGRGDSALGLRCQARQLHGLPLAVHLAGAGGRHPGTL